MNLDVVDKSGKKVEQITLDKSVFGVKPNDVLLAQYLRVYRANQRQGTSSTKTRAEVSGGGKKPWRQKGLGRARFGSIRNPLWRHGGIAHGPKPKSWQLYFSKKMKRAALVSSLSSKQANQKITILDKLNMKTPKTQTISALLNSLGISGKTLIVLDKNDLVVRKSANNIKNLKTTLVDNINAYEVLDAKNVIFLKKAILEIQKKYGNK